MTETCVAVNETYMLFCIKRRYKLQLKRDNAQWLALSKCERNFPVPSPHPPAQLGDEGKRWTLYISTK